MAEYFKDRFPNLVWKIRQLRRGRKFAAGVPPGLDEGEFAAWVEGSTGGAIARVSHLQISGWKHEGAYRVLVDIASRQALSVIFKNEVYDATLLPGLEGLACRPGPPEYAVYRYATGGLLEYLPEAFWAREIEPGERYLYLLEDLHASYRGIHGTRAERLAIVRSLPALHGALRDQSDGLSIGGHLIDYLAIPDDRMLAYFEDGIQYAARCQPSVGIDDFLARWSDTCSIYRSFRPSREMATLVHGDLNPANVHVHRKTGAFRFVDWEWCGFHVPHVDLAALLKGMDATMEERAVSIYCALESRPDPAAELSIYHWCKLERALLDAAYLGRMATVEGDGRLGRFVRAAVPRALARAAEAAASLAR